MAPSNSSAGAAIWGVFPSVRSLTEMQIHASSGPIPTVSNLSVEVSPFGLPRTVPTDSIEFDRRRAERSTGSHTTGPRRPDRGRLAVFVSRRPRAGRPWAGFDAASFVVPQVLVTRTDDRTWLTAVGSRVNEAENRLEHWRPPPDDAVDDGSERFATRRRRNAAHYLAGGVDRSGRNRSRTNRCGTARESRPRAGPSVDLEGPIDVPATLERLGRQYPNCYRFLVVAR